MPCAVKCLVLMVFSATTAMAGMPTAALVDARVPALMKRERVQGLALAIIDRGQVRYMRAWGYRNVERRLPLTTETVMYGASLTKAAFAYYVLKLVDEGRVDLDATLERILPRPPTEYPQFANAALDSRWRLLTPRMLLNHSSGLSNFAGVEPDGKLRFRFDPGARYAYSGAGINLLQFVLEKSLGVEVGTDMQRRVFEPLGMRRTSMSWRDDFAADLADGYSLDGKSEAHDRRDNVRAAGSMDSTIADQAKLWAAVVRGEGLSVHARKELSRPQLPITAAHQFPTLTTEVNPDNARIALAAGLGVVTYYDAGGPTWFKGGHNDVTGNMVICQETRLRCVVLMANDVRAEIIYPEIATLVLGEIHLPWRWDNGSVPTPSAHVAR
jgi:CubicO group peptidase (beta-lactamase class C family)